MTIDDLLADQAGVVSREQVLGAGLDDDDIARLLRRRHWVRVHRGVYVNHTGPRSWLQRAWAAVLHHAPAAVYGESALVLSGLRAPGPADDIHVLIDHARRVDPQPGIRVHRSRTMASLLHPTRRPPAVRLEHAVLQVASAARDEAAAVAVLTDAARSRRTTPSRLLAALDLHPRMSHRALLKEILDDVASGTHSVLEHRYLRRVERPHGLPCAARQRRVHAGRSPAYRDVEYLDGLVVVELDGRLGHDLAVDRWNDLDRDIDATLAGATTIRLGWRQVLEECRAARVVGRLLTSKGWTGRLEACGPGCRALDDHYWGGLPAPGA